MEDQRCMPADNCEGKTQNTDPAVSSSAAARRHARRARAYIALVMVALAATLGAATYAWFTNNMKVNTNSVSVRSDTSKLVLELGGLCFDLSAQGDDPARGEEQHGAGDDDAAQHGGILPGGRRRQ